MDCVSRNIPFVKNASYEAYVYVASTLTRTDLRVAVVAAASFLLSAAAFAAIGQPIFSIFILGATACMIPAYKLENLFRSKIQYTPELEQKFITQARIAELDEQVASQNYQGIVALVNAVIQNPNLSKSMYEANLMPWFLRQVEKLIVNKAIESAQSTQLHFKLAEYDVFKSKQHSISLVSKGGIPLAVNKYALLLISPSYLDQKQTSPNKNPAWLPCPKVSFHSIELFDRYLTHNPFMLPGTDTLENFVDLLTLAKHFEIKLLENLASGFVKDNISEKIGRGVLSEPELEKSLEVIETYEETIDDEKWCDKAKYQAMTNFISKTWVSRNTYIPFQLDQNCFNIPCDLLHIISRQGQSAELLKKVNCITFDIEHIKVVKHRLQLFPGGLDKFESICFILEDTWEQNNLKEFTSIIEQFPKLKTIYINVNNTLSADLLKKLKETSKLPMKIFFYIHLLTDQKKRKHIVTTGDFRKLITDVTFVNLSPNIEFIGGFGDTASILQLLNNKHKIEGHIFKENRSNYQMTSLYLAPET